MSDPGTRRVTIEAWGATDVGMKRRLNEDVFMVDEDLGVYLVADGMGGHAAGEVASKLASEEIIRTLSRHPAVDKETWPEHWNLARSATANLLVDAILAGHQRVTQAVSRDANLKGMGTTVVAAVRPTTGRDLISAMWGTAVPTVFAAASCSFSPTTTRGSMSRSPPGSCRKRQRARIR